MTKSLISFADLSQEEIFSLLEKTKSLKSARRPESHLHGKTLGMIFQKPSTRTAVSFSVAMFELGGMALTLSSSNLQIGRGESMADTARTLSRYVAGIMMRANSHEDLEVLAEHASIPVINGLTDEEHPCQVLADLFTIMEKRNMTSPQDLSRFCLSYVGDGNNVLHSWILAAGLLGMTIRVSCPDEYDPEPYYWDEAQKLAKRSGAVIELIKNPREAVRGADAIYTDVWTSMGQEGEAEERRHDFQPYQINRSLLSLAAKEVMVMHCLPAHRGEEITEEVLEGSHSVVFDQAENRLHAQKAVLLHYLK